VVKTKRFCEKVFWLLLLCSPAIDLLNGIWTYLLAGGRGEMLSTLSLTNLSSVTPALIIRLICLVFMTGYLFILKNRKAILMFALIGFFWALSVTHEIIRGVSFSLNADIQYIVRYCYCLMVLVVFAAMYKDDGRRKEELCDRTNKILCISLFVQGAGILIPYMFGMGFYTYADRIGYRGSRGFFYAGNDITAAIMFIIPIVLVCFMQQEQLRKNKSAWFQAISTAMGIVSLLLIGTKASFLAAGGTVVVLGAYALYVALKQKKKRKLINVAIVIVLSVMLMLFLTLISSFTNVVKNYVWEGTFSIAPPQSSNPFDTIKDSIDANKQLADNEGSSTMIFSGRTQKLGTVIAEFKSTLPLSFVAGVGRGSQETIIEMDIFEVILYYGIPGAIVMLWLYALNIFKMVIDFFKNFSLLNLAVCVAIGLGIGYMFIAGHTLFSVTAGFYFAFMIVYGRLFCSREGLNSKII